MKKGYGSKRGASGAWVALILALVITMGAWPHAALAGERKKPSRATAELLTQTSSAFAEVAELVKPSVVSIITTKTIPGMNNVGPLFSDPFFRRFYGDQFGGDHFQGRPERKEQGLGSGVIVDDRGYILTNNHVVDKADDIRVVLSDKREFEGKVIGKDPKTDLAVIKIEADNLQSLELGDSDRLRVGELVFAVGSPFRLSLTVTMGIVSAKGRANVGIADYEDFIQTDAAINPGNSGGAMINAQGELVGINTAIFSTSGGYQGIGFAIPSNMARLVMDQLLTKGKVVRGWLGVSIQPVTPDLAKQFGLKDEQGALVSAVMEGAAADKAGLRRGDVIVEFQGKKVEQPSNLRNMVAGTKPGADVELRVIRDGREKTVTVTLSEMESDEIAEGPASVSGFLNVLRGVSVEDLNDALRRRFHLPTQVEGVIVSDVAEDSPAHDLLNPGDIVMEVNRRPVQDVKDYEALVSRLKEKDGVLLLVFRQGGTLYLSLSGR